ncbi:MAG: hypothetical protein KDJ52_24080 [Anaerolineae bacterium]|nr:hypothetical protein [Anaerolineae bacterium]
MIGSTACLTQRLIQIYLKTTQGKDITFLESYVTLGACLGLMYMSINRLTKSFDEHGNIVKKTKQSPEDLANILPLEDWPAQDKLDLNEQRPEHLHARPYNQDEIVPNQ